MTPVDSFADLVSRLHAGDDRAAAEVFDRFVSRLVGLARTLVGLVRTHIDSGIRREVDPEDVVQSAFRSFFRRRGEDQFRLESWDSLWGLVSLITVRKCAKKREYYLAQRRGGGRDISLVAEGDSHYGAVAIDREPTPEDAAILLETVQEALRDFVPEDRAVIELSLQGYSAAEISAKLSRAEPSVRRLRERVKKRLWRMIGHEPTE